MGGGGRTTAGSCSRLLKGTWAVPSLGLYGPGLCEHVCEDVRFPFYGTSASHGEVPVSLYFLNLRISFSKVTTPVCIPTHTVWGVPVVPLSPALGRRSLHGTHANGVR